MVIATIDQGDAYRRIRKRAGSGKSTKAATEYDYVRV
jgi:hypothetical protein